jgi:hypothetical protein
MMVMTDGEADIGYVVEDGGRSESDLANQRRAARRSPSERPTDMQDGSRPAIATPLVLRGRPTDPQTRVGWYGSVSQVSNQQGHDAGAERGLPYLPNLGL